MRSLLATRARVLFGMILVTACAHRAPATLRAPSSSPQPALVPPEGFVIETIASGTHVFREPDPWEANVLVVELVDGSLLLVNAPATGPSTEELLRYLDARFGKRALRVINSHFHLDSVGGNHVLLQRGAQIISSRETADLVRSRSDQSRQNLMRDERSQHPAFVAKLANTRIAPASQTFAQDDGLILTVADETIHIIFPGAAHSPDNVVTWLPARGVLFGGCMVKGGPSLGNLGDANLQSWPAAIQRLIQLSPRWVVPGHGTRMDAGQLAHTLRLLDAARAAHVAQGGEE